MLCLSRKVGEEIVIGNGIRVVVSEIRGDKVRLGIIAAKDVPIHRLEVHEAIHGKPAAAPPTLAIPPEAKEIIADKDAQLGLSR